MTIVLGSDHAGFALRRIFAAHLVDHGHAVSEVGATDETAYDYPDAAAEVAMRVQRGEADMGILVCGTGIGPRISSKASVPRPAGARTPQNSLANTITPTSCVWEQGSSSRTSR